VDKNNVARTCAEEAVSFFSLWNVQLPKDVARDMAYEFVSGDGAQLGSDGRDFAISSSCLVIECIVFWTELALSTSQVQVVFEDKMMNRPYLLLEADSEGHSSDG
jgi:hypothetical protein